MLDDDRRSDCIHGNSRVLCSICRYDAVVEHHSQKADDRCIEDDDRLYAAFGLPPCDRRVGDKFEMIKNCMRFVENRCKGGGWPSYAQLEAEIDRLKGLLAERNEK